MGKAKRLPFISNSKIAKQAWDTLERNFDVRGSIEVEDEGGYIATDLHRDEKFVESHYAQSQVDDVCEEVTDAIEKDHIEDFLFSVLQIT